MKRSGFKTRARTVDHLGREQVADCPTAISELWKNAFDAYATDVILDIFDEKSPIAVVSDNGHGMNLSEFQDRWLVIGTESKATGDKVPKADRKGLQERVKQGQKGIGRLSCANLGPILLLVSKRSGEKFVVSLVDWRLFENPFLNLSDIFFPTVEVSGLEHAFERLPSMIEELVQNIEPNSRPVLDDSDTEYDDANRIAEAWNDFDNLPERSGGVTSKSIVKSIRELSFSFHHLSGWAVAQGTADSGTALLVSGINYDLQSQLLSPPFKQSVARTRKNFRETLASFLDPFVDADDQTLPDYFSDFSYQVRIWKDDVSKTIVGREIGISRRDVSQLEHCIIGSVDIEGVFRGRIKAWGKWLPDQVKILPATDVQIPTRADTRLGNFELFIAAMEFDYKNSTHEKAEHDRFREIAELYAGFMIFRDGLRVLPYGRSGDDFFEIDDRRSRHAGREFWNHRRMFGRIGITRAGNPNLKDKAGREGVIDNRAAKALKDVVVNLLMQSARKYFGTDAPIRKELLPDVVANKKQARDAEARRKLSDKNKKTFARNLKEGLEALPDLLGRLECAAKDLTIKNDADVADKQELISAFRDQLPPATIPGAPRSMSPRQQENYSAYRSQASQARNLYASVSRAVDDEVERFRPSDPLSVLQSQVEKSRNRISARVNHWQKLVRTLQTDEFKRILDLSDQRKTLFKAEAEAVLQLFKAERETFSSASAKLTKIDRDISEQNEDIFEPYVRALEGLKESIDLEHLATHGMEELAEARVELERLNSLAQLGIAVEITGHDLQDFDDIIASGLRALPSELSQTKAVRDITLGYEGLTDQLRYLSPLRLSGIKIERWITGAEIQDYIHDFFAPSFKKNQIDFRATEIFRGFRVFDQPSRLFPVFINLVNNSIYWVGTSRSAERTILFDVNSEKIVVADSGPGVATEDIENLFKLFFTRKIQGGRGVGLYLAKANLVSGGHSISYARDDSNQLLAGANFVIDLNGAEFKNG
ncbi:ATP-binding protein [Pseudooceanicola spongiae]|uniref:Histidine kinase n=1 Tax=Pseudooceanicola spongiae TaxID=2613965 RepID=A0A7L9WR42_9RHOB|nr:ATP-binding protein [Pseudooceanicola spongiae]QOL82791.1 histidine kinase [Pseudooceanicola spongiae]